MNDSKDHIITVASMLFLQKSFKEVTMQEIVKETGLSKGAFYHYFESKEQLFAEILDFIFITIMKRNYDNYSKESLYQFYHDYAQETIEIGRKYTDKFKGNQSEGDFNLNYFALAFDALKLFPKLKEKMVEGLNYEQNKWVEAIKNARERGEINSPLSNIQIAQIFIYLSDGVAMHKIARGTKISEMVQPFLELWDALYQQLKT